jgi:small-conductance mechanosensitive channel
MPEAPVRLALWARYIVAPAAGAGTPGGPATRAASGPPTTVARTPSGASASGGAAANDRGVIHQLFLDLGSSKAAAHTAQIYLSGPLRVLVILVVAYGLTRLVNRLSHRLVGSLRLVSPVVRATPRGAARARTLTEAFTQILRAVIWIIAFLEVLNIFSINLTPFVATATVVGAAVGFGAQSLVKDFLSGVLLLAEDQYGVGDHIVIGTGSNLTSGTVESVNLRVTRLRGADGGVVYVPNGDIRTLSNDTETDSQALVDVVVPYGTDLAAAGRAALAAAEEMSTDSAWGPQLVGPPSFAGVQDATNASGVVLRIMAPTQPGRHLPVAREMRLRMIERIRREGLAWAPGPSPAAGVSAAAPGAVPGVEAEPAPPPAPAADPAPPGGEGPGERSLGPPRQES